MQFTLYNKASMVSFMNVLSSDVNEKEDESSILSAVDRIHELLDEELARTRLPSKKLMLGGYSQGGTVALYAALTYRKPLAGVICLSCWLPLRYSFPDVSTLKMLIIFSSIPRYFKYYKTPKYLNEDQYYILKIGILRKNYET